MDPETLAALHFCYLTTKGRRSGSPHTIEIWFALHGVVVYLLAGGPEESDWAKNLRADPTVGLRLGDRDLICQGRVVDDPEEDALARRLLFSRSGRPDDVGADSSTGRDRSAPRMNCED